MEGSLPVYYRRPSLIHSVELGGALILTAVLNRFFKWTYPQAALSGVGAMVLTNRAIEWASVRQAVRQVGASELKSPPAEVTRQFAELAPQMLPQMMAQMDMGRMMEVMMPAMLPIIKQMDENRAKVASNRGSQQGQGPLPEAVD